MKTFEVHIERTVHYIVNVEAQDENDAENKAWKAWNPDDWGFATNDITAIVETNQGE
jgi:hypothetical protein